MDSFGYIATRNTKGEIVNMNNRNLIKLVIEGELADLNHYIRVERSNRFGAAAMKEAMTSLVAQHARYKKLPVIDYKFTMYTTWYCKNKKKDPDNISFAKKFILDGLMSAGIIKNDGWEQIAAFVDEFFIDAKKPRVEVEFVQALEVKK